VSAICSRPGNRRSRQKSGRRSGRSLIGVSLHKFQTSYFVPPINSSVRYSLFVLPAVETPDGRNICEMEEVYTQTGRRKCPSNLSSAMTPPQGLTIVVPHAAPRSGPSARRRRSASLRGRSLNAPCAISRAHRGVTILKRQVSCPEPIASLRGLPQNPRHSKTLVLVRLKVVGAPGLEPGTR
jgi:hypothetical protein